MWDLDDALEQEQPTPTIVYHLNRALYKMSQNYLTKRTKI